MALSQTCCLTFSTTEGQESKSDLGLLFHHWAVFLYLAFVFLAMDQDLISSAKNKKTGGKMSYKRILNYEGQAPDPEDLTDRFSLFIQCREGGITQ